MPSKAPFWFRFWLSFGNMKRLNYLALSPYIEERLSRQLPRITQHVKSIDLPYFFEIEKKPRRFERDIIRFGAFGVGSRYKSADIFFRISREVVSSHTRFAPEFVLVGFLDPEVSHKLKDDSVIVPPFEVPFSRESFADLAKSVDYAIFPSYYQLAVSSALMDAFSYAKPIIALKQPLFEYYFKAMGDIGYLCESYEDMKDLIFAILEETPTERYLTQQRNIVEGREQFSPTAVSRQLATLWKL